MVSGSRICAKRVVWTRGTTCCGGWRRSWQRRLVLKDLMGVHLHSEAIFLDFFRVNVNDTAQGEAALARLKVYEGIPSPYDKTKRMVVPDALKVLRLQKGHKYCVLSRLSSEVGWSYYDTIRELENKRKDKAQLVYERKKQVNKLRVKAEMVAQEKLGSQLDILAQVKY
ncbi:hypothetical protein VNO78_24435 [Psophocarpus tetragonolobus]|uniref:60S ribosomal protein L13a n=1 Tax=Psophocarpus tetragonolobus TaxID=3891 RepID=A0AAN9XF44_PSOTE